MDYLPLSDNAARQAIDSTTVFDEYLRVKAQARPLAGGMYWKRQLEYEYLVKTTPNNRQHRIGPRSPETERTYGEFTARKSDVETRLKSLRTALADAERLNKALKVGRVPSVVVSARSPPPWADERGYRGRDRLTRSPTQSAATRVLRRINSFLYGFSRASR